MTTTLQHAIVRAIVGRRHELGLSQAELAERLGWSRQTIARIEVGTRQLKAHEQVEMCRALEFGVLDLMARASAADKRALRISRLYASDEV